MTEWQPKLVLFLCQWAIKSDSEWYRREDLQDHVQLIEVPCSGRLNPLFMMSALQYGADGVMIVGCDPGKCHYKEGNYLARRKFDTLKSFLASLGLDEKRVRVVWLGETESGRLPGLVEVLRQDIQSLGPNRELATRQPAPCVA